MNAIKKAKWMGAALVALSVLAGNAKAVPQGTSSYLNIDVTFTSALSVAVNSVNSSTYTAAWNGTANAQLFSQSSTTVTNDSGVFTERWKLFTNAYTFATSGSSWALSGSTMAVGADQFMVQAVFGSSNTVGSGCAEATSTGTYTNLTTAPILPTTIGSGTQYTSTALASPELLNNGTSGPDSALNGGSMYGGSTRAMCWRLIMPASTSATQTQVVQVIVAAY